MGCNLMCVWRGKGFLKGLEWEDWWGEVMEVFLGEVRRFDAIASVYVYVLFDDSTY